MAKKKKSSKKKSAGKKKAPPRRKAVRRKPAPKKKPAQKRKIAPSETTSGTERSPLGRDVTVQRGLGRPRRGIGQDAAGQSGDIQGLSRGEISNSESVEELLEEGQSFEAEVVDAVEHTPDADQGEVRTHERPADEISPDDGES